ncbi:hypothetical protein EJV46_18835 [Roseococcus sp. SYP-B2431]|uniref:hypothetical protein n=1 Tax=Roseococcus sp. SYP-B2431 TaxID=2496640 RepID=UPI00103B890C|nr:hypothetical protein [Roseococcus sp. SYP-B2431]TCH96640.1 hypothetical protein EJV46_18835 [Roseococcus sp. SYP-B2431]
MRRRAPWLLLLAGGAAMLLGFGMDPLWPAQDAPPELARRQAAEAEAAGRIYTAGGVLLLLGTAWLLLRLARRRR